jgi:hypothetical protein
LPQVNGCASANFGCTHSIDGLFWSQASTCWVPPQNINVG